jgi:hypothetical protein
MARGEKARRTRAFRGAFSKTNCRENKGTNMKLTEKIQEKAAAGYILLWLLGVPIPVLLLVFLLRGCT